MEGLVVFANKIINIVTFLPNVQLVNKLPQSRQVQWAGQCLPLSGPTTVADLSVWLLALRKVANVVLDALPNTESTIKKPGDNKKIYQTLTIVQMCGICGGGCNQADQCNIFLNSDMENPLRLLSAYVCVSVALKLDVEFHDVLRRNSCYIT
ncbi:uncharacterized protein LOC106090317 [Stomoxys calcitrans]|uniref:uncharacterized protein LOC106090317 n=1 Tax=Stomoxys calcitrans TaxID=35570 RepID=UPI0027E25127|nr:uncharacterized protein LOC106090317 [Stomoxys calcitrans]